MSSTFYYNDASKSKFNKLNFNLKNCVFSYLPFEESLFGMSRISRKFLAAVKSKKSTKIFIRYFSHLQSEINFDKKSISQVKQYFANCGEAEETLNQLCTFLLVKKNESCEILDLREEKNVDFEILANFISQNMSVSFLDLYDTAIGAADQNLKIICDALARNKSIQMLNLNCNKIGENPNHMFYLSEALKRNKTLKKVYFYGNSIGKNENDFFYLADALINNSTIEVLSIDSNEITDFQRDSCLLADALRSNKSLKEIQITFNEKLNKKETKKLLKQANKNLRVV